MLLAFGSFARLIALFIATAGIIVVGFTLGSGMSAAERHLLGYSGTILIILAQGYSLRKRLPLLARFGPLKVWMSRHQTLTILGSALVVVHAGGGQPPKGLALVSFLLMLASVISGLAGAWIHARALKARSELRSELRRQGLSDAQVEDELFIISMTESTFRSWKAVHRPITVSFFATLALHVMAMYLFGGVYHG